MLYRVHVSRDLYAIVDVEAADAGTALVLAKANFAQYTMLLGEVIREEYGFGDDIAAEDLTED